MAECETCKHKGTNTHICDECSTDYGNYEKKIVTNADRIRSMTDEELAEFIVNFNNHFGTEYEGEMSCLDWLQSEAE